MLQLCLQPYKTNIVYKPEQTRVPPATELQEVNNATAAEETLQSLCSKIDSNSKVARGWKKCQPLSRYQQVKQELSVSNGIILRGTCIIVPEKATRSNDYASSQWSTGDCQDKAFSAQFSLVSRDRKNGGESGQRVPAVSSCKPWSKASMWTTTHIPHPTTRPVARALHGLL